MKAVFLPGARQVEVREVPVPKPRAGEVLLAMRAAGLCGSDLHMHYRPAPDQRRGPVFGLVTDPDVIPGHEPAGVVAEVGSQVSSLRVGDRVAVHHMAGCGDCMQCRRGWDINCEQKWGVYGLDHPGAMADYMVVRSRDCVHLPPEVGFDEAAYYTCGAATGYLALKRARLGIGDTVAVVGLGPVGIAAAYFAILLGAKVVALDPVESRRAFAEQAGIPASYDPSLPQVAEQVRVSLGDRGADVVVETSGKASGRGLALEVAALGGRIVFVGFADSRNVLDVQASVIQKQLDLHGAWMFPLPDLQELLYDVSARRISIKHLITGSYGIDDAADAWAAFDSGGPGKTVLHWDEVSG